MTSTTKTHSARIALATLVIALAAGFAQTATAQPQGPGPGVGGPGMGMGMGMGTAGGRGMHGGMHGGMAMGGGMFMERALDSVGASAEQKAQIRQIMDGARNDLRGQREAGRGLHEQARSLFTQPNIDANAAEALRKQMLAQHDQASKRMLQAMLDASRVLTPEQRKQMSERVNQRRAMMERHRAERQSVEGGPKR